MLGWEPRYLYLDEDAQRPSGQVVHLRELMIANLADYHEPRLSTTWEKVLSLTTLVNMKLLVGRQCINRSRDSMAVHEERHEFATTSPGHACPLRPR